MKNNLLGKKIVSCSFYLYTFRKYVSIGFLIIYFCNPGVHYETLCIYYVYYIYFYPSPLCYQLHMYLVYRHTQVYKIG